MEAKFTGGPFETMANMKESVCKKNNNGTLRWGCRVIPTDLGVGTYNKISEECDEAAALFRASPLLYEALEALEWQQVGIEEWECPICHADHDEGHFPDCKLGNALRAARGEK